MQRKKANYISAILSVALVLFILGFFALTALHARQLTRLFKEKVDFWLELKQDLSQEEIVRVVQHVRKQEYVQPETVEFISSEQAANIMKRELGEESMLEQLPEMMRDVVKFNIKEAYFQDDNLQSFREGLKEHPLIEDLYVEATNVGNVGENIRKLGLLTLGLGLLLIFAAVALIHNTIRLDLYANRFLIKNQEFVGASWTFITRPYLNRSLLNGLWSALIAINLLIGLLWIGQTSIPELRELEDLNGILAVMTGLVVLGVLISYLSTRWIVGRFLRMRIDELY
jgi:cell division transport system permease protein